MNRIKAIILSTAVGTSAVLGGLSGQVQAAGNASLSMTGGTHSVGSSFAVPIYVNSGPNPVNVVQADFTYNASQLRFQGVSCGGAFGITAGAGANSVTCGVSGGSSVSGSQLVAVANFKALAGSGSSIISIAPSSHVYSSADNSDIWNGVPTGSGISFYTPAPVAAQPAPAQPAAAAPAPQKKPVVVKHAAPVAQVKKANNAPWIALIALGIVGILAALVVLFSRLSPKKYKTYKKSLSRFVKNGITKPGRQIYKRGLRLITSPIK